MAAMQKRVDALGPWFHNLDLAGVRTAPDHPLGDYPAIKWARFCGAIAENIEGRSVLDIGCNGGFYSIEMKRRGAARVVAIDLDEHYLAQARFAASVCGTDIEFHRLSVYQIACLHERFDIVLFMGVLYHLRHPLLALDLINEHAMGDLLVFQSMQRGSSRTGNFRDNYEFWDLEQFNDPDYPKLHFVEHRYANDATNWWVPNRACAEAMLRSSGFTICSHPEEEVYICRRAGTPQGGGAVYAARGQA
jgi:tRNA (mo5U34)-methyltransferase